MFTRIQLLITILLTVQFAHPLPAQQGSSDVPSELRNVCLYHPEPAWWALGRGGMHGKVVCRLTINPKNGEVTEVNVVKKTRFSQLNAECVLTCFKWRFKPGTVTTATVPFELILQGYMREVH